VWDEASMMFAVEYGGSIQGIGGQRIVVSKKRERNLHVLVGSCDSSKSSDDIVTDLLRRWKAGDESKGKIWVRQFFGLDVKLSGEIRPVLPQCKSETQHDMVKGNLNFGDTARSSDTTARESSSKDAAGKSLQSSTSQDQRHLTNRTTKYYNVFER